MGDSKTAGVNSGHVWRAWSGGVLLLLFVLAPVAQGREKHGKSLKISGKATAVEPIRVTIQDATGQSVTVICREDFTSKVAVGAEVTAWYTRKAEGNYLDWLQYPTENFFLSAEEIRRQIKKVVILPNYGVPESQELVERIGAYLENNLGWYVAPPALGDEIRRRFGKQGSTLEQIDATTGQFDANRYLQAQRVLIERLVTETRVDAVLEVNVERVQAKFTSQLASWDGVTEPVANKTTVLAGNLAPFSINGDVPAATVEMKLLNPQGKLLWSNRRGFAVLYLRTGVGNNFRERPLSEVYQNEAGVNEWLTAALGTLAPSKTSVAAAPKKLANP